MLEWRGGERTGALAELRQTADRLLATGSRPFAALALLDLAEFASESHDHETAVVAAAQLNEVAGQMDRDSTRPWR